MTSLDSFSSNPDTASSDRVGTPAAPASDVNAPARCPFIAADVPTFAELMTRVAADTQASMRCRADRLSALRSFARLIGQRPENMPAHLGSYRRQLRDLHPLHAGISDKRLQNIRSLVTQCLQLYGPPLARKGALPDMTEEWWRLYDQVPRLNGCKLVRFMRWCSASGIAPEAVDDAVVERFRRELEAQSFVKNPMLLAQSLCHEWNRCVGTISGWPPQLLRVPRVERGYSLPWNAFPPSLLADTEAWLGRLAGSDLLSADSPHRPVCVGTVDTRRYNLRQLASAVVRQGAVQPADLSRLADLFEGDRPRKALDFFVQRAGNRVTRQITSLSQVLHQIAKHYLRLTGPALDEVARLAKRCSLPPSGMTEKNRERLRQFNDEENLRRLHSFAERIHHRHRSTIGRSKRPARSAVVAMQAAVAVELLLHCPMRLQNLASIRLDTHLQRSRTAPGGPVHLVFAAAEVKNREPLEFELPPHVVRLLDVYVQHFRPALPAARESSFLFPTPGGRHKCSETVALQLTRMLWKEAGLRMNAHLFRHFAAVSYLTAHPGQYELVRRLLGHRSPETTLQSYSGPETAAAVRHYDAHVLRRRRQLLKREDG